VLKRIYYEQPLNERIRTFLRLEFLFQQAAYHLHRGNGWDSRATLSSILEILNIFGSIDLKAEVMKELERHSASLTRLERNPDVDRGQLEDLLNEMDLLIDSLHAISGQIAHDLKKSEFLTSIRQRSAIPGGTCDFDLPGYHYWLQLPARERTDNLSAWMGRFDIIARGITLILRLTRESALLKPNRAEAGFFQKHLDPNLPYQLVRVALPQGTPYYAEVSGGRHRFTIRFLQFSAADKRALQTDQDVDFELACCAI
jgi:cell division protein ZapD